MIAITTIEDAIIEQLTAEVPDLATCESLGEFLAEDVETLVNRLPAIYVIMQPATDAPMPGGTTWRRHEFMLLFVVKNVRGGGASRRGAAARKGVYDVMADARTALNGQTLGLAITGLELLEQAPVEGDNQTAIFSQRYECWEEG
jgi:phage gp37-like protein